MFCMKGMVNEISLNSCCWLFTIWQAKYQMFSTNSLYDFYLLSVYKSQSYKVGIKHVVIYQCYCCLLICYLLHVIIANATNPPSHMHMHAHPHTHCMSTHKHTHARTHTEEGIVCYYIGTFLTMIFKHFKGSPGKAVCRALGFQCFVPGLIPNVCLWDGYRLDRSDFF